MSTPGVRFQVGEVVNDTSTYWVEMDIANQFQQVGVSITHDRFVAILKNMSASTVTQIEDNGVAG